MWSRSGLPRLMWGRRVEGAPHQGQRLPLAEPPSVAFLSNAGDLESFKKQSFVLKEGVEYRIKISFRVRRRLREVPGSGAGDPG